MSDSIKMITGVAKRDFRNHKGVLTLKGHIGEVCEKDAEVLESVAPPVVKKQVEKVADKQVTFSRRKTKAK